MTMTAVHMAAAGVSLAQGAPASNSSGFAKNTSCSWTQTLMMTGVALSVAGLALAFFTSNTVASFGFASLGIVSFIGIFVAQSAFEAEQLQSSIQALNGQNDFLNAQTQHVEASIRAMKNERDHLLAIKTVLEQNIARVETENARLKESCIHFNELLKRADLSNKGLKEYNIQLEKKILELKEAGALLERSLEEFFQLREHFSRKITAFAQSSAALAGSEENLRQLLSSLESFRQESLSAMQEHVALAKALLDHLKGHLAEERGSHSTVAREMQAQVDRMGTFSSSFSDLRSSLVDTASTLRQETASMSTVLEALEVEKRRVEELTIALETSRSQLRDSHSAFHHEVEALKQTKEDLERIFATTIRAVDQKLLDRDRQILALKERIHLLQRGTEV